MSSFELVIVRHGDPDYARDGLTPRGRLEASALSKSLWQLEPTALYSSPLGRARQTASFTAEALGLDVEILDWVAELDSLVDLEGLAAQKAAWDLPGSWVRDDAAAPSRWSRLPETVHRKVAGELGRVAVGSDELLARYGLVRVPEGYRVQPEFGAGRIVVFCHGGLGLTWLAHLLDLPVERVWAGFYLAPSSVTRIRFERRTAGLAVPRALRVGDLGHLTGLAIAESDRGLYGID